MNVVETLKMKIEEERVLLDGAVAAQDVEGAYQHSLIMDGLIEEYIKLVNK